MSHNDAVLPTGNELLTADEVAELFRVSAATVRGWRRDGYLSAVRTPGSKRLLFRRDEIRQLMKTEEAS